MAKQEIPARQQVILGFVITALLVTLVAHSPRCVLIDRNGTIRGYYTSTDADAMRRLRRDAKTLLAKGG